jgi:hypothetical protein
MKYSIQSISVAFLRQNMSRFDYVCKYLIYKHSHKDIIYNYTPSRVVALGRVKWSRPTVKTHVDLFLKWGWCKMVGNDLVFLSKKELTRLYQPKGNSWYYKITCKLDYKSIRTHLYDAFFQRKMRQMQYKRCRKRCLTHEIDMHKAKREGFTISLRKIAKMYWYRSASSAKKRLREAVESRLVNVKRFLPKKVFSIPLNGYRFKNPCSIYYFRES